MDNQTQPPKIKVGQNLNVEQPPRPTSQLNLMRKENGGVPGQIARQIGTGDNAKDSFVWMTLRACFWGAGLISLGVFVLSTIAFFVKDAPDINAITGAMKDLWSIFTPIITLALGYAFGKRDRSQ